MNQIISRLTAFLLALVLAVSSSQAATGPETAQLLNSRYQNTTAECVGAHPAYFCSEVLMHDSDPTLEFLGHGEVATQLGAEAFVYLRSDLGNRTLSSANGVVAASGRPKAQFFQWDYLQQTGGFLPIVQASWTRRAAAIRSITILPING